MLINIYLLFSYIAAVVLFLGTLGPVTVMVVNASLRGGFRAAFATIVGTNAASLLLITLSFVVISGVFALNERFLVYLAFCGALYVVYFAIGILKDSIKNGVKDDLHLNSDIKMTLINLCGVIFLTVFWWGFLILRMYYFLLRFSLHFLV